MAFEEVVYAKHGEHEIMMDVQLPEGGEGPYPAVLFIHGGGWQACSRVDDRRFLDVITNAGCAIFNIDYRLSTVAPFPAQLQDCKAAVRFVRANAKRFNIDPNRVGVFGGSAGGHLALMTGMTGGMSEYTYGGVTADFVGDGAQNLDQPDDVQAIVAYFPPTDVAAWSTTVPSMLTEVHIARERFLGGPAEEHIELCRIASPVTYLRSNLPPIMLGHGPRDNCVGFSHSWDFFEKLLDLKCDVQMLVSGDIVEPDVFEHAAMSPIHDIAAAAFMAAMPKRG